MVDFTSLTKSDWIQLVQKELKGASYESLIWKINERISIDPYYTREEMEVTIPPIAQSKDWDIGESFDLSKENINATILKGLEGGVYSPLFKVNNHIKESDFQKAFENINFNYILPFLEFSEDITEQAVFETLDLLCDLTEREHDDLICFVSMPKEIRNEVYSDLIEIYKGFYLLEFQSKNIMSEVDISLSKMLIDVRDIVNTLDKEDHYQFFSSCFFTFEIGKNYFFEIAKLRAFSILWGNFQMAYEVKPLFHPYINVVFDPVCYDNDIHINMIRATTMTMSAAIGGASRITVLPSDINGTDFSRRIARNVHHLLAMESHFDKVIDPAAGSYYIDTLTKKIAESAWGIFVNS